MDWIYGQIVGFLGNFFALMGNMGVELFELEWVSAIILFFSRLAWALFAVSVVVCAFECGIEYSTGRGNLQQCGMNIIKGFLAVSLFTVVPVRLYALSVSLQGTFSAGLTGYGRSIGEVGQDIITELSEIKFGFSPKPIPTNIAKKLSPQRCSQPLVIAFFNFSRKRPTFAFTGESGYTLGSLRKIAHSALHAETGVLHSCEAERNISLPPPRAKEQPEEADTRLLRVSASSGAAAPLGCATLFAIWRCYCFFALHAGLPTCAR